METDIMPLSKDILNKYKKDIDIFIETGTLFGSGIDVALECKFTYIHSCEISEKLYLKCKEKYKENNHIHLYNGNSPDILSHVLKYTDLKSLFWLDAHYSGGQTSMAEKKCPILDELNEIKKHFIKVHTILIDDVRLFGTEAHDNIKISEITDLILSINPNYKFTFENDILVAEVQNEH